MPVAGNLQVQALVVVHQVEGDADGQPYHVLQRHVGLALARQERHVNKAAARALEAAPRGQAVGSLHLRICVHASGRCQQQFKQTAEQRRRL